MLTLLTFPASFGMPSHSPFCVKAMGLLNLSGFDWSPEYLDDPRPMPFGRLPVLRDGAQLIADSAAIARHLEAKSAQLWVSDAQRHQGQALIRMAEGPLHDAMVHDRWLDERCWPLVREAFFANMPRPVRALLTPQLRKKVRAKLMAIGIAQFDEAERVAQIAPDLDAIEAHVWEKPYLLGDAPSPADMSVGPVLAMIAALPADTALRSEMRARPGLMAYIERMQPHWQVSGQVPTAAISAAA